MERNIQVPMFLWAELTMCLLSFDRQEAHFRSSTSTFVLVLLFLVKKREREQKKRGKPEYGVTEKSL